MVLASIGVWVDGSALPTMTFIESAIRPSSIMYSSRAGRIDHDVAVLDGHVAGPVEAGEHARIELTAVRLHLRPGGIAQLRVERVHAAKRVRT